MSVIVRRRVALPMFFLRSLFLKNFRRYTTWPNEMKAWIVKRYGGLSELELKKIKLPTILHKNDVLIKVTSASINPIDLAIIGGYGNKVFNLMKTIDDTQMGKLSCSQREFPLIMGRDFTGKVISTGQSVNSIKIGSSVWGILSPHSPGSHAQYVLANVQNISEIPHSIPETEAASFPYVALTGWSAAVVSGGLRPYECLNKKILVIGASGGVGSFLVQLLSVWGAEVYAVCRDSTIDLVLSLGAAHVYDYRDSNTFIELTSEERFDLIIDASGQNDIRWTKALKSWIGASYVTLLSPLLKNTENDGIFCGVFKSAGEAVGKNMHTISEGKTYKWAYFMPNPLALDEIKKLVSEKKIIPVVDKVFSYKEGLNAYKYALEEPSKGKVLIDFT